MSKWVWQEDELLIWLQRLWGISSAGGSAGQGERVIPTRTELP